MIQTMSLQEQEDYGPSELIDKGTYRALMGRPSWGVDEIEQLLNYVAQANLSCMGDPLGSGHLIGGVHIGRLKKGLVYPKVEEMYWRKPGKRRRRRKKAGEEDDSPVFVPYPSYDIIVLWSMPGKSHPDYILKRFAWWIGKCIDQASVSICYFKFVVHKGSASQNFDTIKKWERSYLLYGVLEKSFCLKFYQQFPHRVPTEWDTPAREFFRYMKDRNKRWGNERTCRPPSIQKMLETGEIIAPFQQLGLDRYYEPIIES